MAKLSVMEATRVFDVSRATLQRALKNGTISGERIKQGGTTFWSIDAAELARVYQARQSNVIQSEAAQDSITDSEGASKLKALEAELKAAKEALADERKAREIEAVRSEERGRMMKLLEDQLAIANQLAITHSHEAKASKVESGPRPSLWRKLMGRS